MGFSEEQILTLAPDEASKKSGKDLANGAKWITKGTDGQSLWGECQGSGKKPYQTAVDLSDLAFKCSCPSRKFPCKHGIALGLIFARTPDLFTTGGAPPWVAEWIGKRGSKKEEREDKKEKKVEEAAQVKRQAAREQKVTEGIEDLLVWIKDIIRNGIVNIGDKDSSYWNGAAKRMVDAQAPGLAAMIKNLGSVAFYKEGWQSRFIDALLDLYLVAKGYQNREDLPPYVLQDVRNQIGFTQSQDELKSGEGIKDVWLVAGKQITLDDNLTVERSWLYGLSSNQHALILQFNTRGQSNSVLLSPGIYLQAELVYFPAVNPSRALIKQHITTSATLPQQLFFTWKEVVQKETQTCSRFPVRTEQPYAIHHITPVLYDGHWWLKDKEGNVVAVKDSFENIWKLLALSGGQPLDMVVLGKELIFEPLGVWYNKIYKAI